MNKIGTIIISQEEYLLEPLKYVHRDLYDFREDLKQDWNMFQPYLKELQRRCKALLPQTKLVKDSSRYLYWAWEAQQLFEKEQYFYACSKLQDMIHSGCTKCHVLPESEIVMADTKVVYQVIMLLQDWFQSQN